MKTKKPGISTLRPARFQKGMTMVEFGLVLILGALLLAGVITHFASNNVSAQANQLGTDLTMLSGKIKSAYSGQYANVNNTRLNTGGFFAKLPSLTNNAGVVTSSMGGGLLTISPGSINTMNDSIRFTLTQVPDDACLPLVSALAKGATTISVGSNVVKAIGTPADPSMITCSDDNTTIVFQVM